MDYQSTWERCLLSIEESLAKDFKVIPVDDSEWVYDTWFAPIAFEGYDEATHTLTLSVPDRHVCQYIEHYRMRIWSWALRNAFGPNVRLTYHITQPSADHPEGFLSSVMPERPRFYVPAARQKVEDGLRRVVGEKMRWLPDYDKVVSWLSDNKGKGLLIAGTPGLGKSVLCCDVLPPILGGSDWHRKIKVVKAADMRQRYDELLKARCIVIDDLGKDPRRHFGDTDNTFYNLCEASVNGGPLLVITTNLSTNAISDPRYPDSIQRRYGQEVLDRLKACTRAVAMSGDSLRP